jgi:hypothetical protein
MKRIWLILAERGMEMPVAKRWSVLMTMLGAVLAMLAMSASAALAAPQFWTQQGAGRELLRSVSSTPKNQPAAIEFNNNGPVEMLILATTKTKAIKEEFEVLCNEFEYGTAVVTNNPEGIGGENELRLPWGVAEGDECEPNGGGGAVPVYFDTNAAGVVPATITFSGVYPAIKAKLHKLKMSIDVGGVYCTATFENTEGEVIDSTGPFVEEEPPNTAIQFNGAPFSGTCEGKPVIKFKGFLYANVFVETTSTLTDTVWIE